MSYKISIKKHILESTKHIQKISGDNKLYVRGLYDDRYEKEKNICKKCNGGMICKKYNKDINDEIYIKSCINNCNSLTADHS